MTWWKKFGHKATKPKQGQMELQTVELYKTLVSSSSVGIYVVQNRKFRFANPQFQKYTGYSEDELLGTGPLGIVYPEDRGLVRENAVKMLKGDRFSPYEFRIISRGRRVRWIMERVTSIQYGGERAVLGNCIDITEQREALNRLGELEALEHSILDAVPYPVLVLRDRRIILANDAVEAVFGWSPEELIGKTTQVLYQTEEEYKETSRRIDSVLEGQEIYSEELPCRRKDGGDITCLVKSSRLGEGLKENTCIATFEDITARQWTDEEVQRQKDEFNRRAKELNCLYTISNLVREQDISLEEVSKGIINLIPLACQYPESTGARLILEGQEFYTGNYPETIQKQARDIIVDGKQVGTLEIGYLGERPENGPGLLWGEEVNLINTIAAQLGEIIKYKQAQEMLRNTEANLRHIITNNADGMIVIDKNGIVRFVNPAAGTLLSRTAEELMGKSFGYPVVAGEKTEVDIVRKSGEAITAEMRMVEIEWNGESACLASLRDITERKQIEHMKSELVSFVSNQLRTPAAEIKGYIDKMLAESTGNLTAKQKQYLEDIREISSRNVRLISDLLNISGIERGVIWLDMQPVKLKEIVDLAIRRYSKEAKEKGLDLNFEEMDSEIIVLADKVKTVEALSNVLNNAVKYTDEGAITIKTKGVKGFGIVEVADTGKGMPQDLLDKLLAREQPFTGSLASENGLGLGLYIAKTFMKLQHGDISANSITGKGTSVVLKVPLAKF